MSMYPYDKNVQKYSIAGRLKWIGSYATIDFSENYWISWRCECFHKSEKCFACDEKACACHERACRT